jgi:hypothetical protein
VVFTAKEHGWKDFTALNREESLKLPIINERPNPPLGESCTPTEK